MEFISGEDLYNYAKKYRENNDYDTLYKHLLLILKDIIKGLVFVHSKGILHNDIKPENIMIDSELTPKLVDFGLACSVNPKFCVVGGEKTDCCEGYVGTPDFSSPEMYNTGIKYPASDIWSLGITLYDSATGEYSFDYPPNPTNDDIAQTIRDKQPNKLKTSNDLLNSIVNMALNKNPATRITAKQIKDIITVLSDVYLK